MNKPNATGDVVHVLQAVRDVQVPITEWHHDVPTLSSSISAAMGAVRLNATSPPEPQRLCATSLAGRIRVEHRG
mgnify:CR=1 FL=1